MVTITATVVMLATQLVSVWATHRGLFVDRSGSSIAFNVAADLIGSLYVLSITYWVARCARDLAGFRPAYLLLVSCCAMAALSPTLVAAAMLGHLSIGTWRAISTALGLATAIILFILLLRVHALEIGRTSAHLPRAFLLSVLLGDLIYESAALAIQLVVPDGVAAYFLRSIRTYVFHVSPLVTLLLGAVARPLEIIVRKQSPAHAA